MLKKYFNKNYTEVGIDEAGRGALAGPVFAAAVMFDKEFYHPLIKDSKLLPPALRIGLKKIIEQEAIAYSVVKIDVKEIDDTNILKATMKAMHQCIDALKIKPELLVIDGNYFTPYPHIPHNCIVQGDNKFMNIAAASILAKTYRDEYMLNLHNNFEHYGWSNNKGYGTLKHRNAICAYGKCEHHRQTFMFKN